MEPRQIRRTVVIAAGLALVALLALPAGIAAASGGGGCGRAVTDEAGSTVAIRNSCFGPTIARVAPGDVVTFANRDPAPHTVLGANGAWGSYEELRRGAEASYRFVDPGVYPYVCTYHVGMVGAVVVGDGAGGSIDTTTAAGPVVPVRSPTLEVATTADAGIDARAAGDASVDLAASRASDDGEPWPALALAAFGVVLVTGGTIATRRRRRRSPA